MSKRTSSAKSVPSYRRKLIRGRAWAVVTLTDAKSRERRDVYLGLHGSDESRQAYARTLADWEARGRRLPGIAKRPAASLGGPSVQLISAGYLLDLEQSDASQYRLDSARATIRMLQQHYGTTLAEAFGPKALRLLRSAMLVADPSGERPAWAPETANKRVRIVIDIFRWAASEELISSTAWQALATLRGLPGTGLRKRRPVPQDQIDAVRPHLSQQLRDLVDLQLLTGARPSELLRLTPGQVDRSGDVWIVRIAQHKTACHGHERTLFIGPKGRQILARYMLRPADQFCFSPAEAEGRRLEDRHVTRQTPDGHGNEPGTNRVAEPRRRPGDRWTKDSYRRAIERACWKAWPLPGELADLPRRWGETPNEWRARVSREQWAQVTAWRRAHRWHPYQLRHNFAHAVRRQFGLEAAQVLLGHSSAQVTDGVYTDRDERQAAGIAAKIG